LTNLRLAILIYYVVLTTRTRNSIEITLLSYLTNFLIYQ